MGESHEALTANFIVLEGRTWTAFTHTAAVSDEVTRIISPWFGSCCTWESHCLASLSSTFLFAARDRAFLLQPGSSARVSQTITTGLKFFQDSLS